MTILMERKDRVHQINVTNTDLNNNAVWYCTVICFMTDTARPCQTVCVCVCVLTGRCLLPQTGKRGFPLSRSEPWPAGTSWDYLFPVPPPSASPPGTLFWARGRGRMSWRAWYWWQKTFVEFHSTVSRGSSFIWPFWGEIYHGHEENLIWASCCVLIKI